MAVWRKIEVRETGGALLVRFRDQRILDEQNVEAIGAELLALAGASPVHVVLSFQGVEYLSSMMLGKLLRLAANLKAAGGSLRFAAVKPNLRVGFGFVKLDKQVPMFDAEEQALADLRA